MLYSQSKDTLFCFPCLLFKDDKSAFSDVEKGFNDWKELATRLQTGSTIDAENQKCIKAKAEKWRSVLKCIVDVILHCARNNLPLRGGGGSDSINDNYCGVFLSTLELISHYNPQLHEHIANVKSGKYVPSYFSPKIQNEVIEILGKKVRSEILKNVNNSKYFSIVFDCTPDTANLEQMSQIIRYVNIVDRECVIEESFVDFIIRLKNPEEVYLKK